MDDYPLSWGYHGEKLIAVAVTDIIDANKNMSALSALYTFFDPDYSPASLGTWMILMQIEQAKRLGHRYVYLGYYVDGCQKCLTSINSCRLSSLVTMNGIYLVKVVKYTLNCFTPYPRLGKVCAAKILNYWGNCFTWQKKIVLKWKVLC